MKNSKNNIIHNNMLICTAHLGDVTEKEFNWSVYKIVGTRLILEIKYSNQLDFQVATNNWKN